MMRTLALAGIVALGVSAPQIVYGQTAPPETAPPATFGPALSYQVLQAFAFVPKDTATWEMDGTGARWVTSGPISMYAPVALPNGARLDRISLEGCDTSPTTELIARIHVTNTFFHPFPPPTRVLGTVSSGVTATPGCGQYFSTDTFPFPINNSSSTYFVEVLFPSSDGSLRMNAVRLHYRLEVSKAPFFPTFNDVPVSDPFYRFVEALYAAGITAGCGGGNYCPDAPVTRGQLAVMLAAALGLHFPN